MNYYRWLSTDAPPAETFEERRVWETSNAGPNLIEENVKRAVFRVPNGHILYNLGKFEPHVEIDFDTSLAQLNDERTIFEVALRTRVGARKLRLPLTEASLTGAVSLVVFETDVTISGIFQFAQITETQINRYLQDECPAMLFPRAQKVVATLTRHMGYASIVIPRSQFIRIRGRKMRKARPNVPGTGNA